MAKGGGKDKGTGKGKGSQWGGPRYYGGKGQGAALQNVEMGWWNQPSFQQQQYPQQQFQQQPLPIENRLFSLEIARPIAPEARGRAPHAGHDAGDVRGRSRVPKKLNESYFNVLEQYDGDLEVAPDCECGVNDVATFEVAPETGGTTVIWISP